MDELLTFHRRPALSLPLSAKNAGLVGAALYVRELP